MLIDCDIHVTYRSIKELVPYADAHTRELIERSGVAGLSMPTYPWVHPSGWIRRDTYDADAVEAGSMFIIPPDTPHKAVAVGGPAVVLDVFSPVREDYAAMFNRYIPDDRSA